MRLEPDLKDKLQQIAERDGRTLSNLVEKVLREFSVANHEGVARMQRRRA